MMHFCRIGSVSHRSLRTLCVWGACALAVTLAPASRADNSCDVVYDAGIRQMQTPHHVVSSLSQKNAAPTASETTFAGGVVYSRLGGKWQKSAMTAEDMLERAKQKRSEEAPGESCRKVGEENIDGVAATLYTLHNDAGADSKLWISPADGSILRQTISLSSGTTIDNRYDYKNVEAPAGAR